jgi:hypothetical protein
MDINIPWDDPKDLLNRKQYADFLTHYLSSRATPYVLNINASWGMGKTFFIRHWRETIKTKHPTVYVNAWKSDFSDDPLLAVMSAIYEQLKDSLPPDQKTIQGFSDALKTGGRFLKGIAPIITKGLIQKTIGEDSTEEALLLFSANDAASIAEKAMSLLLQEHTDRVQSISKFRSDLAALIKSATTMTLTPPLYLFIDELDRCRPTYSIELLETVKHLFSVEGAIFVISTDSQQLQHSIKAIYGHEFDGAEYLRRFFEQEYSLPAPDYESYCKSLVSRLSRLDKFSYAHFKPWHKSTGHNNKPSSWTDLDSAAYFLSFFSSHFGLSLRSLEQVVARIDSITAGSEKRWDGIFLIFLACIQAKQKDFIGWLLERIAKRDLKNHTSELERRLIIGGATSYWYVSNHNPTEAPSEHNYTVEQIGRYYIGAICDLTTADHRELMKHASYVSKIPDYARNMICRTATEPGFDHEDIRKYPSYTELAGYIA